jgi:hypothetical protein
VTQSFGCILLREYRVLYSLPVIHARLGKIYFIHLELHEAVFARASGSIAAFRFFLISKLAIRAHHRSLCNNGPIININFEARASGKFLSFVSAFYRSNAQETIANPGVRRAQNSPRHWLYAVWAHLRCSSTDGKLSGCAFASARVEGKTPFLSLIPPSNVLTGLPDLAYREVSLPFHV